jgi:hypothetical protein
MRSSVWLRHRRVLLSCVSCPCGGGLATRGDRVALFVRVGRAGGWGRVSLAAWSAWGWGSLVGLGDGAVVFGHQG